MFKNPIQASIFILIMLGLIIITFSSIKYGYKEEFIENVFVEAHGLLFDIMVIGILLYWINSFGDKQREINRLKDEIDDFRYWKEEEAKYRIIGIVKRLNRLKVTNINLQDVSLSNQKLANINLKGANLIGANLSNCHILNIDLRQSNCLDINLEGTILENTLFEGANFENANLLNSKFTEIDSVDSLIEHVKLLRSKAWEGDWNIYRAMETQISQEESCPKTLLDDRISIFKDCNLNRATFKKNSLIFIKNDYSGNPIFK